MHYVMHAAYLLHNTISLPLWLSISESSVPNVHIPCVPMFAAVARCLGHGGHSATTDPAALHLMRSTPAHKTHAYEKLPIICGKLLQGSRKRLARRTRPKIVYANEMITAQTCQMSAQAKARNAMLPLRYVILLPNMFTFLNYKYGFMLL